MPAKKKLYSYIKKPFSRNGWYAFGSSVPAFLIALCVLIYSVAAGGDVGLTAGAFGLISLLFSLSGLAFSFAGMADRDYNRVFAAVSMAISVITIAEWAFIVNF